MLIPGPTSPGNDIDVFVEPLVNELKDLWENGIETYDASTSTKFSLCAAILWTINDLCYMGHHRFLPQDHKWGDVKSAFDSKKENRDKPIPLIGDDVIEQLSYMHPVTYGKT